VFLPFISGVFEFQKNLREYEGYMNNKLEKQLPGFYKKLKNGASQWAQERAALLAIVDSLGHEIAPRYHIVQPIGVGGVGVILLLKDTNLNVERALKFPRPRPDRKDLFTEAIASEISSLREAAHTNIIEVYEQGKVNTSYGAFPYYIMEYIPDAKDAYEYFKENKWNSITLESILEQVVIGLVHLHGLKILHGDIKLENILISSDGRAVITDFGSARNLHKGATIVSILFTRSYAHPDLIRLAVNNSSTDPNRIHAKIPRKHLKLEFDLFALGKNILRLLAMYSPTNLRGLEPYAIRYIRLIAARLLDGHNTGDECALGLPPLAFRQLKYVSIKEVKEDLAKLTSGIPLGAILPEMEAHALRTIRISRLSPTPFTERLSRLLTHPALRRLASVTQLGLIAFVYPTASHTRLEHMLGALTIVIRYCDALYNDPINPLFRQIMNATDLKALYLATLCHDIGQYPLAHDLEEANHDLFSHEKIGLEMLEGNVKSQDINDFLKIIGDDWGIPSSRIAGIIKADPSSGEMNLKDRILHSIIDGPIDADKVDYLVRDSENLNLPFGRAINFERLLECLTVIFETRDQYVYAALGIHEKGKVPAETIAFARYALFETVYWHHATRAAKAMLHRAVWESLPAEYSPEAYREYYQSLISIAIIAKQEQLNLLSLSSVELQASTQLSLTDRQIIAWVYQKTNQAGRNLLKMLLERQLYKRLLIISSKKNPKLWELFTNFIHQPTVSIVPLQKYIQDHLVEDLRSLDLNKRLPHSSLSKADIDKVVFLHQSGSILVLVDIPPRSRPGSTVPLQYLPESDRREMLEDWKEPKTLEDSVIWRDLHDSLVEAAGKIRVFCHPEIRDTIEKAFNKNYLELLVEDALKSLTTL
jgi:HD superfamily phosphohydrolase/predicted Ser/Thr protein kinase